MNTPALTNRLWASIKTEYFEKLDQSVCNNRLFNSDYSNKVETQIKQLTQRKYCVFTNSGTSAILMSLIALGIKPGDEVICSNLSHPASANQVALLGAIPVFVDVDCHGHLHADKVAACLTRNTRAILPVGLYGENYDYNAIQSIASNYNLAILEDSAQSYGTFYHSFPAGSLGDISILSFARNKPAMTPFGGGALVTDDKELANRAKLAGTHGKHSRSSVIETLGTNAQAKEDRAITTDIALRHMKEWNTRRSIIASEYKRVANAHGIEIRNHRPQSTNNNHKFVLFLDRPQQSIKLFEKHNVQLIQYYQQEFEHSILGSNGKNMPESKKFINNAVVVPTDPFLTDSEVEKICNLIMAI